MQRMVLDQNVLRNSHETLEKFFKADGTGILCDMIFKEMVKGAAEITMLRNLETIAKYPTRIAVLRNQEELNWITVANQGFSFDSLIDPAATERFPQFLSSFLESPQSVFSDSTFQKLVDSARRFFDSLKGPAEQVRSSILSLRESMDPNTLKKIRKTFKLSDDLLHPVTNRAWKVLEWYFQTNNLRLPTPKVAVKSFFYRFFLSGVVLEYYWVSQGGIDALPSTALQNDVSDMVYVASATYFDGVLSREKKVQTVFTEVQQILGRLN